jgi:hypothetical protein
MDLRAHATNAAIRKNADRMLAALNLRIDATAKTRMESTKK